MPAYAAMLLYINYAQIYASIIRQGLPINHQQLLFTASLVDLPLSNAILKEKNCVLVVSLRLK